MKQEIYIPRELEKKLEKYLNVKEIIAVVGPRQCGKTTILKRIFEKLQTKKKLFIDFEDRETLNLFVNDIKAFAELYVKNNDFVFIDEFQYAKNGGKNLKFLFDQYKTKIFISGSSASELSIQSIKYLVGRVFVFNLFPLSFYEFLNYKDSNLYDLVVKNKKFSEEIIEKVRRYYFEFLIYGGYPRVILAKTSEEKQTVLKNIYNTYLLKEIKEILGFKDDFKFASLLKALALQTGELVNYDELSKTTGFSFLELKQALNALSKTFVIIECKPFYKNKRVELVKAPKIYFVDNGFRNAVLSNFLDLDSRTDFGFMNENFLCSELYALEKFPKYWRTKSGAEVDFVLEDAKGLFAIESKSGIKSCSLSKSCYSFSENYAPKKFYVCCFGLNEKKSPENFNFFFLPHWAVLKEFF